MIVLDNQLKLKDQRGSLKIMIPSLFITHGTPMLAVEDTTYSRYLEELGRTLPRPQAIILFSAHWESDVQMISEIDEYSMIYDFGGFPNELYQVIYPAKGSKEVSLQV
jgi:4,5-DOPA dioxygenase extradiol